MYGGLPGCLCQAEASAAMLKIRSCLQSVQTSFGSSLLQENAQKGSARFTHERAAKGLQQQGLAQCRFNARRLSSFSCSSESGALIRALALSSSEVAKRRSSIF